MPLVACQRGREGPESLQGQGLTPVCGCSITYEETGLGDRGSTWLSECRVGLGLGQTCH